MHLLVAILSLLVLGQNGLHMIFIHCKLRQSCISTYILQYDSFDILKHFILGKC